MQIVVEITCSAHPGTAKKASAVKENSMEKEEYSTPFLLNTGEAYKW